MVVQYFTRFRAFCTPGATRPKMLEQLRRTLGKYNFAGQYEQPPAPQGGGMVQELRGERAAGGVRPPPAATRKPDK